MQNVVRIDKFDSHSAPEELLSSHIRCYAKNKQQHSKLAKTIYDTPKWQRYCICLRFYFNLILRHTHTHTHISHKHLLADAKSGKKRDKWQNSSECYMEILPFRYREHVESVKFAQDVNFCSGGGGGGSCVYAFFPFTNCKLRTFTRYLRRTTKREGGERERECVCVNVG